MKKATKLEEQISLFKQRGMILDDSEEKIREELFDIGYFRLGFYCFPFEKDNSKIKDRDHVYKDGTKFSNIIKLYYLDVDLRNILLKYINRIEINFRTKVIYLISNKYNHCSTWFVDPLIMMQQFIDEFDAKVYTDKFKKNQVIGLHHKKYINDKYAPAWKTLEFMTFGSILTLFENIKDIDIKKQIADIYDIHDVSVFINYMKSIVFIRNICAHGAVLFDSALPKAIKQGPALRITGSNRNLPYSTIQVILFILTKVSINRADEMKKEIEKLFNKHKDNEAIKDIVETKIGYNY